MSVTVHLPTVTDLPTAPSIVACWVELLPLLETTAPAVAMTDELGGVDAGGFISWLCLYGFKMVKYLIALIRIFKFEWF